MPRRRAWQPPPVFLPGESHGQKSLVGCSTQGRKESDRTEATYQHTSEIKGLEIYQISPMNYYWFLKPLLFTLADEANEIPWTSVKEQQLPNILIRWTDCCCLVGPAPPAVTPCSGSFWRCLNREKMCFSICVLSSSAYEEGRLSAAVCWGYFSPQSANELFTTWFVKEKLGYTTGTELCYRNRILFKKLLVQKRQLKQKAQLVFQIYIRCTHIYLNSRALWKKILACFVFIRLSLCSLCICWLDFTPIPFFASCCINLFEDLLLLLLSRKKCFFYITSFFPVLRNLILNGIVYVSSVTSLLFKMSF